MKKVFFTVLSMFIAVNLAYAQFAGGFNGPRDPSMTRTTVQQALSMQDDAIVVLKGKITHSLGDEKYMFKDNTGEVIVGIDNEDWHGITVTPEDTIEIVGEVDKELFKPTKIEVKSFTLQKQ